MANEVIVKLSNRDWIIILLLILTFAIVLMIFAYVQVYFANDFYPTCDINITQIPCIYRINLKNLTS